MLFSNKLISKPNDKFASQNCQQFFHEIEIPQNSYPTVMKREKYIETNFSIKSYYLIMQITGKNPKSQNPHQHNSYDSRFRFFQRNRCYIIDCRRWSRLVGFSVKTRSNITFFATRGRRQRFKSNERSYLEGNIM